MEKNDEKIDAFVYNTMKKAIPDASVDNL